MSENIDIKIREDGTREAAVNIRAIGTAADETVGKVGGLNQGLNITKQAVAGTATATQSAVSQINQLGTASGNATQQIAQLTQQSTSFAQQLQNFAIGATAINVVTDAIGGLWDKLMAIPTAVYDAVRSLTELQAQVDKLAVGFKFGAGGDSFLGGQNAEFVNGMVQKLGLNINQTADAFLKFTAATKGTALQGEQTREIFSAISEAAAVLHLNAEQTSRTFLALEQMASKGVVSMEELRRQLGDNLPGAFQIAARALGVTTAELDKMVRSGQVLAEDFLPKFAEQVKKEFGGAVSEAAESAQASLGRLDSAWTNFKRTVSDSGLGEAAKGQLDILTEAINGVTQAMQRAKSEGSGFWGQFGAGLKSFGQWFVLGEQNSNEGLAGRINAINNELNRTDLDKFQRWQLIYDKGQATAQLAKQKGAGADDKVSDSIFAATALAQQQAEAYDIQRQGALNRVNAYNEGDSGKYLTKQQNLDKALKTINQQFEAATKDIDKGSKEYAQALDVAAARKKEAMDKFNAAGVRAGAAVHQNELGGELAKWKGYADDRVRIEQTAVAELQDLRNKGELSEKEYIQRVGQERQDSLTDQLAVAEKQAEIASGRKALAERERYLARTQQIEEQLRTEWAKTQAALSDLDKRTRDAGTKALLSLQEGGDKRGRSIADQLSGLGSGPNQQALDAAVRQAQDRAGQSRLRVDTEATKLGTKDSDAYREAMANIDAEEQAQISKERDYLDVRLGLQKDWATGASKAFSEYYDKAQNVAKSTEDLFTTAFGGMEDSLANFVTTGKLDFTDFVSSIFSDLAKLEIRILLSSALSSILGSSFGQANLAPTAGPSSPGGYSFSSGSLAGTGAWATGGYTGAGGVNEVAGLVHKGEVVWSQDDVARAGGVGSVEAMRAGAGTAAATPATSTPGTYSGGGGAVIQMSVEIINNAGDKTSASASQGQDENGNPKLTVIIDSVEQELAGRMSTGRGPLYKATKGAFGLNSNPRGNG